MPISFSILGFIKAKGERLAPFPLRVARRSGRSRDPLCCLRRECALCFFGNLTEGIDVMNREISQSLAVKLDVCFQQTVHEAAVAQTIHAGGGIDTHDPQATELTLLLFTTDVGILAGFGDGLLCYTENFTTGVNSLSQV